MPLSDYSAREQLRDGRPIEIRALRRDDEAGMLAAIDRMATRSLQRRFFVNKRSFSEKEKAFFMDVDFVGHAALVAVIDENGSAAIVGGGRYVVTEPGVAEVAFVVVDAFQGQGICTVLARHLISMAKAAGLRQLAADVLPINAAMRKVLGKYGFQPERS
jgi:RimJ/RimL family protein N-acetyltransferase